MFNERIRGPKVTRGRGREGERFFKLNGGRRVTEILGGGFNKKQG